MLRLPLRERVIDLEVPEHDVARGRAFRKATPRSALAELSPSPRSATEILIAQDADRLPKLVPLRYARMLADPRAAPVPARRAPPRKRGGHPSPPACAAGDPRCPGWP